MMIQSKIRSNEIEHDDTVEIRSNKIEHDDTVR